MNTNIKKNRSVSVSQASIVSIQGDVSRRIGSMRAVTLENRVVNTAPISGPRKKRSRPDRGSVTLGEKKDEEEERMQKSWAPRFHKIVVQAGYEGSILFTAPFFQWLKSGG